MPANDDTQLGAALQKAAETQARRPSLRDVSDAVTNAVRCAVDTVPGADAGAVSLASPSTGEAPGAPGATSASAVDLDAIQHHLNEGPCLSAMHDPGPGRSVVVAEDLAGPDATRWPRFAPSAVERGFPAVLSVQLPTTGTGAALNLYGRNVGSFEATDLVLAEMFVEYLAHLLFSEPAAGTPHGHRAAVLSPAVEHQLWQLLDRPAVP